MAILLAMLPAVLEWNATVLGARSYAIADAMGRLAGCSCGGKDTDQRSWLATSLRQLDVPRYLLQQIAERAYSHPVRARIPVP